MTTVAVIILMFILGFLAPKRVRRINRKMNKHLKPLEKKAEQPKVIGPVLKAPIKGSRKAAEKSLKAGKKVRDKAPF